MKTEPGYEPLASILQEALDQAQTGKGKERHATDEPFAQQEICNGARLCGLGAMAFQVRKKILEAVRLIERNGVEAGAPDILGAINYAAAMLLVAREAKMMAEKDKPKDGRMTQQFMDSLGPWWPRDGGTIIHNWKTHCHECGAEKGHCDCEDAPPDHNMIKCASCGALKPTNTMCKCGW
jgi:hypothetical protein